MRQLRSLQQEFAPKEVCAARAADGQTAAPTQEVPLGAESLKSPRWDLTKVLILVSLSGINLPLNPSAG